MADRSGEFLTALGNDVPLHLCRPLPAQWTDRCTFAVLCLLSGLPTGIVVSHSCDRNVPMVL